MDVKLAKVTGPHKNARVLANGNTKDPKQAVLLFHGRGSSGENIMRAVHHVRLPEDAIALAPTAHGNTWYPERFLVERTRNEPHLSSALEVVRDLLAFCADGYHIPSSRITLAGFSQGACLISDFAANFTRAFKGLCIWSGGLIGSDKDIRASTWRGALKKTPVYIGCDEQDSHIPAERVKETARILALHGANVSLKLYKGLGHAVDEEGYQFLDSILNN